MPALNNNNNMDYSTQTKEPRNTYSTNWSASNNIWAPPIGTGKKETARPSSRPPPLSRTAFGSEAIGSMASTTTSNQITGSGSLLSSSECVGWPRKWDASGGNTSVGSAGGRPPTHRTGTSPVRNRASQHTRESSPFYANHPSAIGTLHSNNSASSSLLDPTTMSFAPRNNSTFLPRSEDESVRKQSTGTLFGAMNGAPNYSGYASSAASRNGSLPPSRHGIEQTQFGDFGLNNPATVEAFVHRPNQHSRNSNFSIHSHNKVSTIPWQSSMGDLSSNFSRMDVGLNGHDRPGSSYWDPSHHADSPGSANGMPGINYPRTGSLSLMPGTNLVNSSMTGYNQQRLAYGQDAYSPTGSDSRNGEESPMYMNNPTPPSTDWTRGLPSHNSRTNLNGYGGYGAVDRLQLDRALNQVADSQNYQPSPALSHRSLYSNGYNMTGSNTPNHRMGFQGPPFYNQQTLNSAYGQSLQSARHPPRGPSIETPEKKGSPLLQEFHMTKGSKKYELRDIYGHVVEFSGDQHGSRYLQSKLETANSDEKAQLFSEILPNASQLMTDLFGNYVIQKFFEYGNQQQKKQLADKMRNNMTFLSMQMYACRVVQKALDVILVDQQASLIKELDGKVIKCVKDQNGNHVIQKAIERIPSQHITFITSSFTGQVHHLAVHNYGCRVIQRMLESSHEPAKTEILEELQGCVTNLVVDQFGNYVTQNIVKHGRLSDRDKVIAIVTSNLVSFATQKYASNVVETAFVYGTFEQRQKMIGVATSIDTSGDSTMIRLMRDQFGNYIIQRFIKHLQEVASVEEYENFVDMLKPQLENLKNISYGKQIGQIEKLITGFRAGHTTQGSPLSNEIPTMSSVHTPPLTHEEEQSPRSSSHPSTSHSTTDESELVSQSQKTLTPDVAVAVH